MARKSGSCRLSRLNLTCGFLIFLMICTFKVMVTITVHVVPRICFDLDLFMVESRRCQDNYYNQYVCAIYIMLHAMFDRMSYWLHANSCSLKHMSFCFSTCQFANISIAVIVVTCAYFARQSLQTVMSVCVLSMFSSLESYRMFQTIRQCARMMERKHVYACDF